MHFRAEEVATFLSLFEANKHKIVASEGCHALKLLQDIHYPHTFFTYSHWESETALNAYRKSALFGKIWPATKVLFAKPAEAWTVEEVWGT